MRPNQVTIPAAMVLIYSLERNAIAPLVPIRPSPAVTISEPLDRSNQHDTVRESRLPFPCQDGADKPPVDRVGMRYIAMFTFVWSLVSPSRRGVSRTDEVEVVEAC